MDVHGNNVSQLKSEAAAGGKCFFFFFKESTTVILFQVSSHHCVHLQCNICMLSLVQEENLEDLTHINSKYKESFLVLTRLYDSVVRNRVMFAEFTLKHESILLKVNPNPESQAREFSIHIRIEIKQVIVFCFLPLFISQMFLTLTQVQGKAHWRLD